MNELNLSNKTFDLSQNSFVIFMTSYAPGLITGTIALVFINSILPFPDFLEKAFYIILFIAMLVKAIMSLQLNKRTLILSEDAIEIYWKKRKNNILLTKINNDEITSIKQFEEEAFVVTKKDGQEEILSISCHLKPYKILLYSIKKALFDKYGNKCINFEQDNFLTEYINNKTLPKQLQKVDNDSKATRLLLIIVYLVFAGLPTIIALLAILLLILMALMAFLKGIVAILSIAS